MKSEICWHVFFYIYYCHTFTCTMKGSTPYSRSFSKSFIFQFLMFWVYRIFIFRSHLFVNKNHALFFTYFHMTPKTSLEWRRWKTCTEILSVTTRTTTTTKRHRDKQNNNNFFIGEEIEWRRLLLCRYYHLW